ncbi:MAG: c-type cytochrome [Deltaproteobacteria bacterium]|nr:c-type cytochrome [Deltaproteobacteria bacterium]
MRFLFAAAVLAGAAPAFADAPDGAAVFSKRCAGCHGADGKGETKVGHKYHVADLSSPAWARKTTPEKAHDTIANGVEGKMPPMKHKLSPEEVDAVTAYVFTLSKAKSK